MATCIRSKDWSETPFGPLESWPHNLRITVNFCVGCNFPLVILWGPNHLQIYNDAYRQMCGSNHPRFLGEEFSECWPSAWPTLRESFSRALQGETCFVPDQQIAVERDGRQVSAFYHYSCSPLPDESGTINGIICSTVEREHQAKNSPALQEEAALNQPPQTNPSAEFRSLIALLVGSLEKTLADPDHTLTLAHRDRLELVYANSLRLLDLTNTFFQFAQAKSMGQTATFPSGESVPLTTDFSRDSTAGQAEDRFRRLVDTTPALIWMSGPDKKTIWFNKTWLDFIGLSMDAALSNCWTKNIHPDDFAAAEEIYLSAFNARKNYSMEYRLRRHDGIYRWVLENGAPSYAPDGTFIGYIGSCVDFTEQKNHEAALKDADLRKDEFLAMLAHELRNPLAPIRTALEVLERYSPSIPLLANSRAIIIRQVEHLSHLVDDLLDVSRITSGRISLKLDRVELSSVINQALEACRPFIHAKHQELTVTIPAAPVYLTADPIRLVQIITNLLSNASKFSNNGGKIQLTVEVHKDTVRLKVKDDGIGIPAGILPRVFDLFTQAPGSLDRSQGGLGIGLTLVKKLVELHGGTIKASSEGNKAGSEFLVVFPLIKSTSRMKNTPTPEPSHVSSPRKILVVDDKVDGAKSLAMLLTMQGHQVQTAHDGPTALQTIKTFHPDIVLLDIGLPGMSGYEVAAQLQDDPERENMLLVALTGYGQPEDRLRSSEAGFDSHLVKPASPQALASIIALSSQKHPAKDTI